MYSIKICQGHACGGFKQKHLDYLTTALAGHPGVEITVGGCFGKCAQGPNIKVVNSKNNKSVLINQVNEQKLKEIVGYLTSLR